MVVVKDKYILVLLVPAIISAGILFSHHGQISDGFAAIISPAVQEAILVPIDIDQNFLDQVNECFIPTAAVYGYSLRVVSDFRSAAEQEQLYNQGRVENGHIVSWAEPGKSLHNYGYAVDVVDRWKGYDVDWKKIEKIGTFCSIEQVDDPHFEYRAGLTTADFADGKRPPLLQLPCEIMRSRAEAGEPLTIEDLINCNAPNF